MPRLTLADLTAEPTTLELDGHVYTVRTMSRSVEAKHDAALKKFKEADDDSDKNVDLLAKTIETLMAAPEGAPPIAKALVAAWKADTLGLGQIHALYDGAAEASFARPTSRRTN